MFYMLLYVEIVHPFSYYDLLVFINVLFAGVTMAEVIQVS